MYFHIYIYIYSTWFLSHEGPMLETLEYTIRIGSSPTFLYFDFISTLPTQHATFNTVYLHVYIQ